MLTKPFVLVVLGVLSGCATTDTLYVGTYTRAGIDLSTEGGGAGIGVKSVAMTIAPTKESGEAYDILGKADIDLAFNDLAMYEVVATGPAAVCASGRDSTKTIATLSSDNNQPASPLIFASISSWSLIEVSLGDVTGPGVSFGYKRTVGIRMPIKDEQIGSTFASVAINTTSTDHPNSAKKSEVAGARSVYVFSTGNAALKMAQQYAGALAGDSRHQGCADQ